MNKLQFDVVVIGGGPAGMGAALKAQENGASVALVERNPRLGGILLQCIHSGFGLRLFKKELTGPEYAQRFINRLKDTGVKVFLSTMVLRITPDREVVCMNETGITVIHAKAVVLAMGCRERTRGEIKIPGDRCAGVMTAGQAQHYINIDNFCPGRRFVILGSGDIGLIMARRLSLEGMKVEGVYELMPYPNGLVRNLKNCLEDFGIPLHLSTTVSRVIGKNGRVSAVEVTKVDDRQRPLEGTSEIVPCDTLLLSVGLVPENELSLGAGVRLNPRTNGAAVDDSLQTSVPGVFSCGNVLHVHDLADNVTMEAERAGESAAAYAKGVRGESTADLKIHCEEPIGYTVPSVIRSREKTSVMFRVRRPCDRARLTVISAGEVLLRGKPRRYIPSIMEELILTPAVLQKAEGEITMKIESV
ncbi:Ferredoxin--NADP reductase [Caprobacter fermentans]|uniref:Ferredoxin--NADP reductase n=1 Tax=Caproicibacter fermentans TaxID=2576756 RepID=A0A6N8HWI8_9FIRM|nr:FAD-dependent oxidoreductase [Caproicibacter fermentans]MVB10102.1 Ferredoxin--NADP reductase [Caproicibacter fermentans]